MYKQLSYLYIIYVLVIYNSNYLRPLTYLHMIFFTPSFFLFLLSFIPFFLLFPLSFSFFFLTYLLTH